jgi:two-component system cell cycle response regulator
LTTPRILVADDSPLVVEMLSKMLTEAGFGVAEARDGVEAVQKAMTEELDLVILDVGMPRLNGYHVCRLLKSEPTTRELPIVILTSRDQAADRFWGMQTGADHYLTKDAPPHQLLDLVQRALGGRTRPARPRSPAPSATPVDLLSRMNELLDRKLYEATILSEIGRVARSLVRPEETFTSVMGLVGRVVDFTIGSMAFLDVDTLDMVFQLARPVTPAVLEEAKARLQEAATRDHGAPFTSVRVQVVGPPPASTEAAGRPETALGAFACFPVVTQQAVAGILAVGGGAVGRLEPDGERFLGTVANLAHMVVESSRLFERVQNLSMRDSLTELYNHRHAIDLVSNEVQRMGRYQDNFSVLMIDVDHFKDINDRHGHPAGDGVLRELAQIIKETLRTVDAVGRYGGEEFIAILPHTAYDEARLTAERVRVKVASRSFRAGLEPIPVTVSVGVATYPSPKVDSANTLIREADLALYRAKQGGRNRVA